MKTLTRNEGIAIIVGLIVIAVFFGRFFINSAGVEVNPLGQIGAAPLNTSEPVELKYTDMKVGEGAEAKDGDTVRVHYTGVLADGQLFDSSVIKGQPIEFVLGTGAVIQGWDLGILGMKEGGKRRLEIPSQLAYGEAGFGNVIPPNATLYFIVDLVKVVK